MLSARQVCLLIEHRPWIRHMPPSGQRSAPGKQRYPLKGPCPAQMAFSRQLSEAQSASVLHSLVGGACGKKLSPTPRPAEPGSLTKVTRAVCAVTHFDRMPAAAFIEPELSSRTRRSTGTCCAPTFDWAHEPPPASLALLV